jgi:hypothetical protein
VFCDLVGSTALSARLDPEDLRAVIGAYHQCVAAVRQDPADPQKAEACFRRAVEIARGQQVGIARCDEPRPADAR